MPSRVSRSASVAVDAKTRSVVANASSKPPPSAKDATAAMLGIGRASIALKTERALVRKSIWLVSRRNAMLAVLNIYLTATEMSLLTSRQRNPLGKEDIENILGALERDSLFHISPRTKALVDLASQYQCSCWTCSSFVTYALYLMSQLSDQLARQSIPSVGTIERYNLNQAGVWSGNFCDKDHRWGY